MSHKKNSDKDGRDDSNDSPTLDHEPLFAPKHIADLKRDLGDSELEDHMSFKGKRKVRLVAYP